MRWFLLAFAIVLAGPSALAQDAQGLSEGPAQIVFAEGTVTLERDGAVSSLGSAVPLVSGDRLRTDRGRVELLLGDGSVLAVDEYSTLDLLSSSLLRLLAGRLYLIVARSPVDGSARSYQVDTPVASARTKGPGEYRLSVRTWAFGYRPETELAVVRGFAQLVSERGVVALNPGELSRAPEGGAPGYPHYFNSAHWDGFERWVQARTDARRGAFSAQHLPLELRPYAGTFDRHGTWAATSGHGYVWYPTGIAAGWRPYSRGHWVNIPRLGWTWIGAEAWSSPTHHYGRWGVTRSGTWFWIPMRGWAPAWVQWAIAPGFVSWCALGPDGRPVIPFRSFKSVTAADFGVNPRVFDPSFAWNVIPHASFGQQTPVVDVALGGGQLRALEQVPFITQQRPPLPRHGTPWQDMRTPSSANDPSRRAAVPRGAAIGDLPRPSVDVRDRAVSRTPVVPVMEHPVRPAPSGWSSRSAVPRTSSHGQVVTVPGNDGRQAVPANPPQQASPVFRHGSLMPPVRTGGYVVPRAPVPPQAPAPQTFGVPIRNLPAPAPAVRSTPVGGWVVPRMAQPRVPPPSTQPTPPAAPAQPAQ